MKNNLISVVLMFLIITMMPIFASSEETRCTINIESAKAGTEDKTQLIIVRGHIDETIQDLLPTTIIIVELNGVNIPG